MIAAVNRNADKAAKARLEAYQFAQAEKARLLRHKRTRSALGICALTTTAVISIVELLTVDMSRISNPASCMCSGCVSQFSPC